MDCNLTVVVPVFNGERFLQDAVESVKRQAGFPTTIIVVDDGSTDSTAEICEGLGSLVSYVRQENQGPAVARNTGILRSQTDFVAFLDADDLWPEDSLKHLFAQFAGKADLGFVLGKTQMFRGKEFREAHHHWLFGAGLYRREVFEQVGLLAAELRAGEDLDWFLRARRAGTALSLIEPTTLFLRREQLNMTHNKSLRELNFHRVIKRHIERQRG